MCFTAFGLVVDAAGAAAGAVVIRRGLDARPMRSTQRPTASQRLWQ